MEIAPLYSTILGSIGGAFDKLFQDSSILGGTDPAASLSGLASDTLNKTAAGLGTSFLNKGAGALSSYLTAELAQTLGVDARSFGGAISPPPQPRTSNAGGSANVRISRSGAPGRRSRRSGAIASRTAHCPRRRPLRTPSIGLGVD